MESQSERARQTAKTEQPAATNATIATIIGTPVQLNVASVANVALVQVPAFPADALPEVVWEQCERVAQSFNCPIEHPLTFALPGLGALIGKGATVQAKPGWTERPCLWTILVALSGQRKSAAMRAVMEPLDQLDHWLGKRGKQLITTDCSIAALRQPLMLNRRGLIYRGDELKHWVQSMTRAERGLWLSFWSGETLVVNRVGLGKQPFRIPNPFLAATGCFTPTSLSALISDTHEDVLPRCLCLYPDPLPRTLTDHEGGTTDQYRQLCKRLRKLRLRKPIDLSVSAKDIWTQWHQQHSAATEQTTEILQPTFDKAPSHCLRIALIFYLCDFLSSNPDVNFADQEQWSLAVDEKAMASAIQVMETYKAHAYRVYQTALVERKRHWQDKMLLHIRLKDGKLNTRDAQQLHLGNKTEVLKRFYMLQQEGYGAVKQDANHPGQATTYFELGAKPTVEVDRRLKEMLHDPMAKETKEYNPPELLPND
jgi:hypothetical protein